ncbi:MAG: hypothetical protein GC200_01125 [Tepidisphaera sp.]|nr:hypothetical protein [Tepidisphaera sp.]
MPLFSLPTPPAQDLGPRTDDRGRALPEVPRADIFKQLWGDDGVPKRLQLYMLMGPLVAFSGFGYFLSMQAPRLAGGIGIKYGGMIAIAGWVGFMSLLIWSRGGKRFQLFGAMRQQQHGVSPTNWIVSLAFVLAMIVFGATQAASLSKIDHLWAYYVAGGFLSLSLLVSAFAWRRAYLRQNCKETGQNPRLDKELMLASLFTMPLLVSGSAVIGLGFAKGGKAGLLALGLIAAGGLVMGIVVTFISFSKLKKSNTSNPMYGSGRLVAWLAASNRCGACAYPLVDVPIEPDGVRLCPECGCAWHKDRATNPAPAPDDKKRVIEALTRVSGLALDDRGVPLPIKLRSVGGWLDDKALKGEAAELLEMHHRKTRARRTREGAFFGLIMWLVLAGLTIFIFIDLRDVGLMATSLGLVTVLIGVWVIAHIFKGLPADEICTPILAHACCPGCAEPLNGALQGPATFDACVNCPACGMAWKRERIVLGAADSPPAVTSDAPAAPEAP